MPVLDSLLAFFVAIAPLLLVLLLLSAVNAKLLALVGRPLMLMMAFFAVPLHKLSQLVAAKLCGQKIDKVSFFSPTPDGRLGYVAHSYKPSVVLTVCVAPDWFSAFDWWWSGRLRRNLRVDVFGVFFDVRFAH